MNQIDPLAAVPTVRQLRVRLRRARRGHHSRSVGDFLTDLYMVALFLLMYGFATVRATGRYLNASSGGPGDAAERYWIGVAAVVAGAGLAWQALRAVGPLLSTRAGYSWCVSTPVDRRGWMLPRLGALLLVAAAGFAAGSLAADDVRLRSSPGWAALAGATYGMACAALAVVAQYGMACAALAVVAQAASPVSRRRWPHLLGAGLIGLGAVTAVAVIAAHFAGAPVPRPAGSWAAPLAAVGLLFAIATTAAAVRALPRLDRAALTSGAPLASAAVMAAVWLDLSMLSGVLQVRRWQRVGRVTSRRFLPRPSGRIWVLLQAEFRRQARHPSALGIWAALALGQYATAVAVPAVAGVAHLIGAYLAANRLASGLRTISGAPGLRRALGGGDTSVRLVHLAVPLLGTALWWLVTWPAAPHRGATDLVLVVGVVAAVYRAATKPPMSYGGMAFDTPLGLIPVGLIFQLIRGPDVLAVLIIVQSFLT
jgi:hypothetical protein